MNHAHPQFRAAPWLALVAVAALPACIIEIGDGDDEPYPPYPPVDARRPVDAPIYGDAPIIPVDAPLGRPDAGVDARPTPGPGTYDFVFLGEENYRQAIRLGNRRGESATLRRLDGSAKFLSLSPRGDRVAYSMLRGLHVLSLVDGSERTVGDGIAGGAASWSPDGEQLVFTSMDGSSVRVLRVTADTGAYDVIARDYTQFGDCVSPDWSPDGTEIAFGGDRGLRVYSLATGQERLVAAGQLCQPRWSPSGAVISFTHFVAPLSLDVIGRRGGPSRQLARLDSQFVGLQRWSPDGQSIAYVDYDQGLQSAVLRLARFDGTPPAPIATLSSGTGSGPAWSPGGDALLYVAREQGARLRLWDAATGGTTDVGSAGVYIDLDRTYPQWFAAPFVVP